MGFNYEKKRQAMAQVTKEEVKLEILEPEIKPEDVKEDTLLGADDTILVVEEVNPKVKKPRKQKTDTE